jgi:hypothetical protein
MTNNKPVCFIAMAFDHDDTDALYESQILPALKRNNITSIIINRRQSNDDLNIQIIEQLEKADFCITDLTYARPSVYYEAGYAQRVIPVIYTVRKDHLSGHEDHLRVHFDLQMKPIIPWGKPDDPNFSSRLEKRIKSTILNRWNKDKKNQLKQALAESEFENQSVSARLIILRAQAIRKLQKLGFSNSKWIVKPNDNFPQIAPSSRADIVNGYHNYISANLQKDNITHYVSVQSFASLPVETLRKLYNISVYQMAQEVGINKNKNLIIANILVLSLKPTSADQIEKIFTSIKIITRGKRYSRIYRSGTMSVYMTYHFLTGIKSQLYLEEPLSIVASDINELMMNNKEPKA